MTDSAGINAVALAVVKSDASEAREVVADIIDAIENYLMPRVNTGLLGETARRVDRLSELHRALQIERHNEGVRQG